MFSGSMSLRELTAQCARDPCKELQHVSSGVVSYAQDLLLGFLEVCAGIRDQYSSSPVTHLLYGKGSPSVVPDRPHQHPRPDLHIRTSGSGAQQSASHPVAQGMLGQARYEDLPQAECAFQASSGIYTNSSIPGETSKSQPQLRESRRPTGT